MSAHLLVVDDSHDVTQVMTAILTSRGYSVAVAQSGAEALASMEGRRPDLILCDILMPEMDGFEVFRRVRAERRWQMIPFVFITALNDARTRLSSSELGVEAYLTKPFRSQELVSVVAGLLRRAEELHSYNESEMESFKLQLLFMITHELTTPLSVIRMLTDNMRNNLSRLTQGQVSQQLDLLARSTRDLSYIVESMLLALQIDSGRAKTLYDTWAAPQMIRSIVDAVVTKISPKAGRRNVAITVEGGDELLWIRGHDEQLAQIFGRILDNAIQFSPQRSQVVVCLARDASRALVTITDHGPGMSPEEIAVAFDRLHQINRPRQEQQGVGLSLSLVRALVAIHGGELLVESTPGVGTRFTVALPLTPPPA